MIDKLNEAAEKYAYNGISDEMKSLVKPIGDEVIKNFKAGAEWQKNQMMKDAVKAEVYKFGEIVYVKECSNAELAKYLSQFNNGDKVKIIAIHETDIR